MHAVSRRLVLTVAVSSPLLFMEPALGRPSGLMSPDSLESVALTSGSASAVPIRATFSGPLLWPTITSFDARIFAPELPVPFYVIQGRDDHVVSFQAAKDYVDQVRAPAKAFIPIDGGHFACFTHAATSPSNVISANAAKSS